MATEIERKFLVTGTAWRQADGVCYSQGYLNRDKGRTVRVRVAGDHGYLTIKGATTGASRAEYEYEIPLADAEELLKMCDGPLVQKLRYLVIHNGFTWEVDEFLGDNAGLVVAEIELESEDQLFDKPGWVSEEVTDLPCYFNFNLAVTPFCSWNNSKHPYKLRPGYGSSELLLEFASLVDDRRFADDLFHAMAQGGFIAAKGWNLFGFLGGKCTAADLTFCSTVFFHSRHGALSISVDEWDGIHGFGVGKNGQAALIHADKLLRESGLFEKIEVDFADYLMPSDKKEQLCQSDTSSGGIMKNLIRFIRSALSSSKE